MYILFEKSGDLIATTRFPLVNITTGGLVSGAIFSGRFLSVVFLSYLFVLTTEPSDLAYALMKAGLPYRWGFMFVTALRLAPIMEEEGRIIYRAQLARGIQYDRNNLKKLLLYIQQFMSPLLIVALRRVDKLVFSMEGRGFGKNAHRSFYRSISPTYLDLLAITSLIITLLFIIL
jgi:energy-coupling factor transport system permease protein